MDSILTVTVPATATNLTTRTAFKAMMGISDTASDDKIDRQISRATAAIQRYCDRVFARETVSELFRLDRAASALKLGRFPVASITSVTEDGVAVSSTDYEVDKESGLFYRLTSDSRCCWTAAKIVVVYVAGYLLPGESNRSLPADLEEACLEQCRAVWFNATRDPLVKSEDVPGVARVDYWVGQIGDNAALAPQVVDRIDSYCDGRL